VNCFGFTLSFCSVKGGIGKEKDFTGNKGPTGCLLVFWRSGRSRESGLGGVGYLFLKYINVPGAAALQSVSRQPNGN
jgi:hypothetical protein